MGMQISYKFNNRWKIHQLEGDQALVGRPNSQESVDIDLSPDTSVSRRHARIWVENATHWVEDLKSKHGTLVNGKKLTGRIQIKAGDTIRIGETDLQIDNLPEESE